MRKITQAMLNALDNHRDFKRDNTEVEIYGSLHRVFLYGHEIYRNDLEKQLITFDTCGYYTATTLERLRALSNFPIFKMKGQLYLDTIKVDRKWHLPTRLIETPQGILECTFTLPKGLGHIVRKHYPRIYPQPLNNQPDWEQLLLSRMSDYRQVSTNLLVGELRHHNIPHCVSFHTLNDDFHDLFEVKGDVIEGYKIHSPTPPRSDWLLNMEFEGINHYKHERNLWLKGRELPKSLFENAYLRSAKALALVENL